MKFNFQKIKYLAIIPIALLSLFSVNSVSATTISQLIKNNQAPNDTIDARQSLGDISSTISSIESITFNINSVNPLTTRYRPYVIVCDENGTSTLVNCNPANRTIWLPQDANNNNCSKIVGNAGQTDITLNLNTVSAINQVGLCKWEVVAHHIGGNPDLGEYIAVGTRQDTVTWPLGRQIILGLTNDADTNWAVYGSLENTYNTGTCFLKCSFVSDLYFIINGLGNNQAFGQITAPIGTVTSQINAQTVSGTCFNTDTVYLTYADQNTSNSFSSPAVPCSANAFSYVFQNTFQNGNWKITLFDKNNQQLAQNNVVIDIPRNPVIIIPGVAGTRLNYIDSNGGDHGEIWPNIALMIIDPIDIFLNYLSLSSIGEERSDFPMTVGDIIRKINILGYTPNDTFGSLIDELTSNGYTEGQDLFVFPYDWRFDLKNNVSKLSEKINAALSSASKVDIVAHSMGGLLAKEYIHDFGASKVNKLIFAGTPHTGSPWAYKTLIYGNDMDIKKFGVSLLNPQTVKNITQNMPSIYELLPSRKYIDDDGHRYITDTYNNYISSPGSRLPSLDYNGTRSFMISRGSNANMFPLAERLHTDIDNIDLAVAKTYNFVGCGSPTLAKITDRKKIVYLDVLPYTIDDPLIAYTNGDKTVPRVSAEGQPTTTKYFVNKIEHGDLPSTSGVRETIRQILLGQTIGSFGNVSANSSVCSPIKGDIISYHSPIALHIYDSAGNHTGPISGGDMEYGILGVSYDSLDEAKFAYLPEGDTYTVKGNATDTGSFDLLVQKVNDTTVLETTSFNDVPLNTINTNSSISITPGNQTSFNLKVDQDGNGSFESNLTPTSTLNQTQSADVTSPATALSLGGTAGTNNWYISDVVVTLMATDDNSGILKTEYSLDDGVTYTKYISPFTITREGATTVKYFSVDKIGNMEPIHSQSFKIDKTPPEAKISFDQISGIPKIEGTDNVGTTTVTKVDGSNYAVKDDAGHTLKINLTPIYTASVANNPSVLSMTVGSLKYDSNPTIKLSPTNLRYEWLGSPIEALNESIIAGKQFSVAGVYNQAQNKTTIITTQNNNLTTQTLSGVRIIKLTTIVGGLEWEY